MHATLRGSHVRNPQSVLPTLKAKLSARRNKILTMGRAGI